MTLGQIQKRSLSACGLLAALLSTAPAQAGNNSAATVRLSWDEEGLISTVSVPPLTPFPLFLHIEGAPDVRQLALTLSWMPYDSTGQCYSIVPASADSACGWTTALPPGGDFEGDSTYTWSILFPPGLTDRSCVIYWVSMATCDSAPPAKFYVALAQTKDSNGAVDTLRNIGDTKLLGGPLPDTLPGMQQFQSGQHNSTPSLTLSAVPNPSSSDITLRFTLPAPMPFSLGIYDVSGRLVRRAEVVPSAGGSGSFRWDLADVTGRRVHVGLYFARLTTISGSRIVPLTVLR